MRNCQQLIARLQKVEDKINHHCRSLGCATPFSNGICGHKKLFSKTSHLCPGYQLKHSSIRDSPTKEKLSLILVTDPCRLPSAVCPPSDQISAYVDGNILQQPAEARPFSENNSERSNVVSCEDTGLLCGNDTSL